MIKLCNISKEFKSRKRKVEALKDVNISFGEKGFYGIYGESGAGKSTLFKIITLQSKCTSGSYLINGKDVTHLKSKEKDSLRGQYFGIVFQDLNLIEEMDVLSNIRFSLEICGNTVEEKIVLDYLEKVNLPADILNEKVKNLSGGQKQRVAIVRALIKNPKAIICDEPTGSLDEANSQEVIEILKNLSKEKLVIIISHNESLVRKYADYNIRITNGTLIKEYEEIDDEKEEDEEPADLKKRRLPLLFNAKMGLYLFKRNIGKMIFSCISFIIAITFLFSGLTFSSYSHDKAVDDSFVKEGVGSFTLSIGYSNSYRIRELYLFYNDFAKDLIEEVTKNNDDNYYLLFRDYLIMDTISAYSNKNKDAEYAISTISEEVRKSFGYTLYGQHPLEDTDIALTLFDCYQMGILPTGLTNIDDYIQKNIIGTNYETYIYNLETKTWDEITYTITGIIDTNFYEIDESLNASSNPKIEENRAGNNVVFFTQNQFEKLVNIQKEIKYRNQFFGVAESFYVGMVINYSKENYKNAIKVMEEYNANVNDSEGYGKEYLRMEYPTMEIVEYFDNQANIYSLVINWASVIMFAIGTMLLIGIVISSIYNSLSEIEILRSLGISYANSSNIYGIQAIYISSFCSIISICCHPFMLNWLNSITAERASKNCRLVDFNIWIVLGVVSITILSSFIISKAIAMLKFSRQFKK